MELPITASEIPPSDRRAGWLVGAVIGSMLTAPAAPVAMLDGEPVAVPPPPGRRRGATALADALLAQLAQGGVDLHRLAHEWVQWWESDGFGADGPLGEALGHLREFDAPPDQLSAGNIAALAATLPAALTAASPRGMVSGTFHVARLLDPDPLTGLASVAVVVAGATLLEGRQDFVADVIAVLRANDAPPRLLDPVRHLPRDPYRPPAPPAGVAPDPVDVAVWALWTALHRHRGIPALRDMALLGGIPAEAGAVLGALLGARDGTAGWPPAWTGEEVVRRRALAEQLDG
jgi:hypothetical protein